MNTKTKELVKLHRAGFKLVPAPYKSKNPVVKDWLNKWIRSEEELLEILKNNTNSNFVIIPHDNWIVFDIDPRNGGLESFEQLRDNFAPTFKVKTGGGGFHYYYLLPKGFHKSLAKDLSKAGYAGIDIKTSNGCLVAPTSTHPNGNLYKIAEDSEEELIVIPMGLLKLAIRPDNYPQLVQTMRNSQTNIIPKGSRNNQMTSYVGYLFRKGHTLKKVLELVQKKNLRYCKPPLPYKELVNIVKSVSRYNNIEQARKQREERAREIKEIGVADNVEAILTDKKQKAEIRFRLICELIIRDLNKNGKFYKSNGNYYIFDNRTKLLISIDKGNIHLKCLLNRYRINAASELYKAVYEALIVHCDINGQETEVYKYAHIDMKTNILYVKNGNCIQKITDKTVELCENGTDKVLFTDTVTVEPFTYTEQLDEDYLGKYILDLPRYSNTAYLNDKDLRLLTEIYLHSIFMPELLQTKPIISTVGIKGSGKTTLLRMLIKCTYGQNADVISMANKMEDLDTIVANKHFVVIDNLDTYKDSINDKIACYATRVTNEKRKLYSNGEVYRERVEAFLGISTRNPVFRRDDVAQRVLIIYLDPINQYSTEGNILRPMLEHRSKILSQIIQRLQSILALIKSGKYANYQSGFRMADFAHFTALYIDNGEAAEELLHRVVKTQQALVIEGDILLTLLTRLVYEKDKWNIKWLTARELFRNLEFIIQQEIGDTVFSNDFKKRYDNPISLAKRLMNIRQEISDFIVVETKRARGNILMYQLAPGKHFEDWVESLLGIKTDS